MVGKYKIRSQRDIPHIYHTRRRPEGQNSLWKDCPFPRRGSFRIVLRVTGSFGLRVRGVG